MIKVCIPGYSAKITEFLKYHPTASTFRRIVKKKFPRRKFRVFHPNTIYQCDLMEYTTDTFKYHNSGYRYGLLLIDAFTKKLYGSALKNKSAIETADAVDKILSQMLIIPTTIVTDGTYFVF